MFMTTQKKFPWVSITTKKRGGGGKGVNTTLNIDENMYPGDPL